jgi:hypothetical protein
MAARYDVEMLLDDIETLLKANLNTKIATLEAEKVTLGKGVGLASISTNAYVQQTWDDKILNLSPAIFYGIETIETQGANAGSVDYYKIFVEVVLVTNGMDTNAGRKIHRYSRALREVFHENFDRLPWSNKTNIETVRPISFTIDGNSSDEVKVGGVSITTALAS